MIIGVPKEIKADEYRAVAFRRLSTGQAGPSGCSMGAARARDGHPDADYERAGATLVSDQRALFEQSGMIVKVKEPQPSEYPRLRPWQILFTYPYLAASRGQFDRGAAQTVATGLAYETIEVNHRLPLLEPMSEIAGRMSVLVGGYFLQKHAGGCGVLLGGVPGVLPGRVVVLGGGASGINAARMAIGLGADVTILEVDLERMRFLDITLHTAHTLYSSEAHLISLLPTVDLLIGAVLVPGARAPKLISREMLRQMRPGSVLVDIAIDQVGAPKLRARPRIRTRCTWRRA